MTVLITMFKCRKKKKLYKKGRIGIINWKVSEGACMFVRKSNEGNKKFVRR